MLPASLLAAAALANSLEVYGKDVWPAIVQQYSAYTLADLTKARRQIQAVRIHLMAAGCSLPMLKLKPLMRPSELERCLDYSTVTGRSSRRCSLQMLKPSRMMTIGEGLLPLPRMASRQSNQHVVSLSRVTAPFGELHDRAPGPLSM